MAVEPDINIIDGRKIFIDGGPDKGRVVAADTIIINSDLMKADLKSYDLLFRFKKEYGLKDLDKDPYRDIFFKHFHKIKGKKK